MRRIPQNIPLQVDAIYIEGEPEPLRDQFVIFVEGFLIVSDDENDESPTWYNQSKIIKLEGVQRM